MPSDPVPPVINNDLSVKFNIYTELLREAILIFPRRKYLCGGDFYGNDGFQ